MTKATEQRLLYPIQVVARRTGVSIELLRAWERRYRAVAPKRMQTGRRLYSDDDVARLTLLRRATEAGLRIKDAAGRTDQELRTFLSEQTGTGARAASAAVRSAADGASLLERCKEAVRALDGAALERILARARVEL